MSTDSAHRTLVLSVVAVDLVRYSQKSVAEQMSLKDHFNQVLLQAIRDISIADRIILDTGDGVAMGFLGDPEDALFVAMFMHDAINRDSAGSPSGGMDANAIRIGINLGPVKLATGVGGHPNIIGDGINVAERIMSFAEPGQLTASRPFFEVMSRMSDHYATLFQFAGVRTDKQVRAHDVYLVGKSAAAFHHAEHGVAERAAQRASQPAFAPVAPVMAVAAPRVSATPAKAAPPTPSATAKQPAKSPPAGQMPAPLRTAAKSAEIPAPSRIPGERFPALIDFLEDRNKVATTATLLAIVAVTLAALLAYRKLSIFTPETGTPAIAALSPAPIPAPTPRDDGATAVLPPAIRSPAADSGRPPAPVPAEIGAKAAPPPVLAAKIPGTTVAPKEEIKAPAPATNTLPPAIPAAAKPAATPVTPVATPPAKAGERPSGERAPLPADAAAPGAGRDKPKDAKSERADRSDKAPVREEIRNEARKPIAQRPATEREKNPSASTAPIVPTYQSPAEAPRPAAVAPTLTLSPPAAASTDSSVNLVSHSAPPYPIEGIRQHITSGLVKARVIIDANGNVSDVVILESRPISAFGRETRTTVKQWKYNPGTAGRIHEIEITFKP